MISYILRRILASLLTLVVAAFLMYLLAANAGNPLQDLLGSNAPNAQQLIARRVERLQLDVPPPLRFFGWLGGAVGCFVPFATCDLGTNLNFQPVTELLPGALGSTVRLVTAATLLAIILGIVTGLVSALRQYSAFDVGMTFVSFFLYSLPSFLVAVLLKEFMALGFNDWLQTGGSTFGIVPTILIALGMGLLWQALIGGTLKKRLITAGVAAASTAALLVYFDVTNWFQSPSLGPVGLLLIIVGLVFGITTVVSGLANRRALLGAAISGGIAYIAYFSLQWLLDISSIYTLMFLGLATFVVSFAVGWFIGGPDRSQVLRASVFTGMLASAFVLADRFLQSWGAYINHPRIRQRPIATVGESTTGLRGDVWITGLDTLMHFMLPTIALTVISFAGYTRYARAGLLEVLNQDYIRTARAKGLPERTVIMRHAFRNMLIPITTIVAADVGSLLGGAIITERVFAISGMGALFDISLQRIDINPIMGYFLVVAVTAILFNFIADMCYALLDPRVRVK